MHAMIRRVVCLHRQEGTGADMQGHGFERHTGIFQRGEQSRGEMQPCSRRGNRAVVGRKHRLVVVPVAGFAVAAAMDIRREGHAAVTLELRFEHGAFAVKAQGDIALGLFRLMDACPVPPLELRGLYGQGSVAGKDRAPNRDWRTGGTSFWICFREQESRNDVSYSIVPRHRKILTQSSHERRWVGTNQSAYSALPQPQ